jgi:hypothetical protein
LDIATYLLLNKLLAVLEVSVAEIIKHENTCWQAIRSEGFHIMAPAEWLSRKLLFFYQQNSWLRVFITLAGGLAILATVLNLSQWKHDRRIQQLNLFVQIKEGANGAAVAALLKALVSRGIPPEQIPMAKANLSYADLSKLALPKAYFKEADLKGTIFRGANLSLTMSH